MAQLEQACRARQHNLCSWRVAIVVVVVAAGAAAVVVVVVVLCHAFGVG
jgi:hypothetical protein